MLVFWMLSISPEPSASLPHSAPPAARIPEGSRNPVRELGRGDPRRLVQRLWVTGAVRLELGWRAGRWRRTRAILRSCRTRLWLAPTSGPGHVLWQGSTWWKLLWCLGPGAAWLDVVVVVVVEHLWMEAGHPALPLLGCSAPLLSLTVQGEGEAICFIENSSVIYHRDETGPRCEYALRQLGGKKTL